MPRGHAPSKKDTVQPAIEAAFIRAGYSVCDVHALGKDAPDLFVAKGNVTIAIECKTGNNKRIPHQAKWAATWNGFYLWGNDPATLVQEAEYMYFDFLRALFMMRILPKKRD